MAALPVTPAADNVVVEKLPSRSQFAELRQIERLRRQLQLAPQDDATALRLVRSYFDAAMALGDPRLIGYAQAILRTRFTERQQEAEWWFASGLLKQYTHDFSGALQDFAQALQRKPDHPEALSWMAALHMVQGEYAEALRQCQRLEGLADPLTVSGCSHFARAGMGQLQASYDALWADYQKRSNAAAIPASLKLWVLVRLGEMAERLGLPQAAEQHYQAALRLGITDQYLLAAYADFLLTQQRPAEVLQRLQGWETSDVLLLRLAQAAQRLNGAQDAVAERYRELLRSRFEEAVKREERLHEQEEARFLLELAQQPAQALLRAQHNYLVQFQREPRDMQMLLLAAVAANDRQAAQPVLRWMEAQHFEDARMRPLMQQLQSKGG